MPVVINEFEVVDETTAGDAPPPTAAAATPTPALTVEDLALLAAALAQAQLRLWSH